LKLELTDQEFNDIFNLLVAERERAISASLVPRAEQLEHLINQLHTAKRPASRPTKLLEQKEGEEDALAKE